MHDLTSNNKVFCVWSDIKIHYCDPSFSLSSLSIAGYLDLIEAEAEKPVNNLSIFKSKNEAIDELINRVNLIKDNKQNKNENEFVYACWQMILKADTEIGRVVEFIISKCNDRLPANKIPWCSGDYDTQDKALDRVIACLNDLKDT